MKPIDLTQFEGMTPGEWAWQQFGGETYSLTAQHGRREQIINAIKHKEMGYPVVAMNKDGRLCNVNPEWPNARAIAACPVLISEVKALREALGKAIAIMEDELDYRPDDVAASEFQTIKNTLPKP